MAALPAVKPGGPLDNKSPAGLLGFPAVHWNVRHVNIYNGTHAQ